MACIMRPHNSSSVIGERVWVVSVFGSYFTAKTIADKQDDAKKDETKRHDKEQV